MIIMSRSQAFFLWPIAATFTTMRAEGGNQAFCFNVNVNRRSLMQWSKPDFSDMRFGFEVTMYVHTR